MIMADWHPFVTLRFPFLKIEYHMYTATYPKSISEKDKDRLARLFTEIEGSTPYNIGYPVAKDFDYSELYHFL